MMAIGLLGASIRAEEAQPPPRPRIRPGRADDVEAISEISEAAYSRYIERLGRRPSPMDTDYGEKVRKGELFVAEDGSVIGFIILLREDAGASAHLLIENVAVDPRRHGTGIGRSLLDFAESEARRRSLPAIRLYTHIKMTENQAIYAHLGYREYERDSERSFMEKGL